MNGYEKMREALEFADRELRMATEDDRYGDDLVYLVGCMRSVAAVCRAALAIPPRQCDVGTAYEQANRMSQYCATQKRGGIRDCAYCPIAKPYQRDCALTWAQMPYGADDPAIDQLRYKMEGEAANG